MNIGDNGPLGQIIFNTGVVQTRLDTLTEQASSGYVSNNYAGLGANTATAISLQPQIKSLAAQNSMIDIVNGQMGVAQTALTQINAIATTFRSQITTLTNVNPGQVDYVASAAKSALQQMASLLDTANGSNYVFAGTDSGNPPIADPGSITSAAFYQQIGTAVQGLAANGASATQSSIVTALAANSPFSAALQTQPASSLTATVQVSPSVSVQTGLLANKNTIIPASSTPGSTGSYMQDIMMSLATLANLSSSQVNDAGFTGLIQGVNTNLTNAISAMGSESGSLGNTQSVLTNEQSQMDATSTALTQQVSSVEDVDMARTISSITEVQTQLTASYKLIAQLKSLSLANYL